MENSSIIYNKYIMEKSKQHTQLPHNMLKIEDMEPKDLIVYIAIKRYVDKVTGLAKVSFTKVAEKLKCSEKTVRNSVSKLKTAGYIKITHIGKCNAYSFPKKDDGFEEFFVDFIDNPNMTYQQKAFYAAQLLHMYKENGICKNTYNLAKLSSIIHLDPKTIKKYEREFKEKGWMIETKTKAIDVETGCSKVEKIYFPDKFGQAMLFIAAKHEKEIQNHEGRILNAEDLLQEMSNKYESLKKDFNKLKSYIETLQTLLNEKQRYSVVG